MGWSESYSSQRLTKDTENKLRGLRVFHVWDYARAQILHDPTAILNATGQGLPAYNSDYEGMKLDGYEITPVGSIYDATALYSNDGRFRFPPPPPSLHNSSWTGSFQTDTLSVPYAQWTTTKVVTPAAGGGQNVQDVSGWEFLEMEVLTSTQRIGMQCYLSDAGSIDRALAVLPTLGDTLQKIRGRWYRFEGADYAEEADGKWRFNYNLSYDPGLRDLPFNASQGPPAPNTPWIPSSVNGVQFEWPPASHQLYVRPPFHRLIISANASGVPSDPPQWFCVRQFDDGNPLGWAALPGFRP